MPKNWWAEDSFPGKTVGASGKPLREKIVNPRGVTPERNHHLVTAAEEIADFQNVRPHLVVLGAGASRAAFPDGERNARRLPLMVDFTEIVPVASILEKSGIDYRGKNFEEVYSLISERAEHADLRSQIKRAVFAYFADLQLPDTPTLYDALVLSLRQKDVIATFNWDPFLIQACQRSARVTESLPCLLFLHGNVAHGYCARDRYQGPRGEYCPRCGERFQSDKLLFPVAKKDYSFDPSINKAWEVIRVALRDALAITIFGYSAPASDKDAISIMHEAWGNPGKRQFEAFEIIDVKSRDEVRANWAGFVYVDHYRTYKNFKESMLARHPRRSGESFLNRYIHGKFLEGNLIPEAKTLDELQDWFRPLIEVEKRATG
jgi:hypothetical protein